ncbi:MAG TPA: hypothetical protein DCG75_16475 [Bacteroidales bacterium]|nr:hypothetical protein [Bacteroidales bacterium]
MKSFIFFTTISVVILHLNTNIDDASIDNKYVNNETSERIAGDKKCIDCHSDIIEKKVVHFPASESCEDCHLKNEEPHPGSGVKGFSLAEEGAQLCYMCHDNFNTQKKIHYPVEDGNCVQCHSPHSSDNLFLLIETPSSGTCFTCHDKEEVENKKVHNPYEQGDCAVCHDPHQSNFNAFLKKETFELCVSCHDNVQDEMKKENVHAPADDCLNCHQAHVSEEKYLLEQKIADNCYSCHDQVNAKKYAHLPVQEGECNVCHSPHGSPFEQFLLSKEADLCLSCHQETIWKTYKKKEQAQNNLSIHAAIEMGACSSCHNPHSSDYHSLLTKNFPVGLYSTAEKENFEVCFDCHDSNMLTEDVKESTSFRNGDQNLHYLHINGEKGRNCNTCHDMHSSTNEHLILNKVMFGKWEMQMKYKPSENGGSCAPGCHGETIYVR